MSEIQKRKSNSDFLHFYHAPYRPRLWAFGGLLAYFLSQSDKANAGAKLPKCTACPVFTGSASQ